MKNFYEFYQMLKAKTLLEQDMGDPMASAAGAAPPPAQGGAMPPAPPAPPPAGAAAPAPEADETETPEAGSEDDMSNASPSEGELDTSDVKSSLEALEGMIDNFKSQDEEKGTQYETLVNQLKSLVASLSGEEEEEGKEEEGEEAPPEGAEGVNPIPSGTGMESPEAAAETGMAAPAAAPGAGTMQGGEAMANAAPAVPMA